MKCQYLLKLSPTTMIASKLLDFGNFNIQSILTSSYTTSGIGRGCNNLTQSFKRKTIPTTHTTPLAPLHALHSLPLAPLAPLHPLHSPTDHRLKRKTPPNTEYTEYTSFIELIIFKTKYWNNKKEPLLLSSKYLKLLWSMYTVSFLPNR